MTHLVVVDGSNLFMRNYHGLKAQDLRTESGHPTWGTYGYFKSLSSLSQLLSPTHLVVAWDFGKSAKRHLLDPNYKMNRTSTREDDLALQLDDTQRLEVLLGIKSYGEPGVEAEHVSTEPTVGTDAVGGGGGPPHGLGQLGRLSVHPRSEELMSS